MHTHSRSKMVQLRPDQHLHACLHMASSSKEQIPGPHEGPTGPCSTASPWQPDTRHHFVWPKTLPLEKPLICLDIETPMPEPGQGSPTMIQLAAIKIHPTGQQEIFTYDRFPRQGSRFPPAPGDPAPKSVQPLVPATTIHLSHVTYQRYQGAFESAAAPLYRFLDNCDLMMYNAAFDLQLLQQSFAPYKLYFPHPQTHIIDPWRIFCYYQPRDLAAAHQYYCQQPYANRHTALADAQATLRVFVQQLERHPNLPKRVENISQFFQSPKCPVSRDKAKNLLQYNVQGEIILNIGKYKNKRQTIASIHKRNPGYLHWILKNDFPSEVKRIIEMTLQGQTFTSNATELNQPTC